MNLPHSRTPLLRMFMLELAFGRNIRWESLLIEDWEFVVCDVEYCEGRFYWDFCGGEDFSDEGDDLRTDTGGAC